MDSSSHSSQVPDSNPFHRQLVLTFFTATYGVTLASCGYSSSSTMLSSSSAPGCSCREAGEYWVMSVLRPSDTGGQRDEIINNHH